MLVGPTGVGKTELSLCLAQKFPNIFEIISVDSVQIYRLLNIGSGKPGLKEREIVKHHLIDVVDPDYSFSAGDFCRYSLKAVESIVEKKRIPFFVGGTGLYIDSFFKGLSQIPHADPAIREELNDELKRKGLSVLYDELLSVDNVFAAKVHQNDKQRILRGLEVYRATNKPISSFYLSKKGQRSERTFYLGLNEDRTVLRDRIDKRVDEMIENGFVEEVKSIREKGYGPELKSMNSIGYKEINMYIDGINNLNETVNSIKTETKKYAKRQRTWFRKNKEIQMFQVGETNNIEDMVSSWLDDVE
ncbi:tRNA (adenosine(37)-N6)-dimethylallyltransferase MiaA [Spirochaetota bacterium]